jgi:hypothetical protein
MIGGVRSRRLLGWFNGGRYFVEELFLLIFGRIDKYLVTVL